MTSYVLLNRRTKLLARRDSVGEHDGLVTDDVGDAKEFATYGEASDYGQNFGADWQPEPTHLPVPAIDCNAAIARALDEQTGGR